MEVVLMKSKIEYSNFDDFFEAMKRLKPKICRYRHWFISATYLFAENETLHTITITNKEQWHAQRMNKILGLGVVING
jgi:hypothetical protein